MFSFVPALAAGGDALIGNVDKVNLFIQFDLLRQLVEPRVFDDKDMIAHGWGGKPLCAKITKGSLKAVFCRFRLPPIPPETPKAA